MKNPRRYLHAARAQQQLKLLREVEGYGETSVRNLFTAIEERRKISLDRFIFALGIRQIGETTALHWRAAMARGRPFTTPALKVAKGDEETIVEMDALDQIGDTVITAVAAVFRARSITSALSNG